MTYAPHSGAATSIAAAQAIAPTAEQQREKVLAYVRSRGIHGATRQEIGAALSMPGDSVRPRCIELMRDRLVELSGEIRRSETGRACEVLVSAAVLP